MGLISISITIHISLLIISLSSTVFSNEERDSKLYIVHLESPADGKSWEELESWYHSLLSTHENKSSSYRDPRMLHTYKNVFTGFAAWLSPDDVTALEKHDRFLHARPERVFPLHTTHSPNFLGLNTNFGLWKNTNYGKGVIIGVVDTGIFPGHPSFSDEGMPPPPAKWKGKCEFNFTACNNKLIGARYFSRGINDTPLDDDGHGTHVAGTAAGSFVAGADFFGKAYGTAAGVAPLAHLAVYRACPKGSCPESDVLAAMDAAIEDGVDILSLSLGFPSGPFAFDAVALGAFTAVQKGVFVSCSAGNNGPSYETLENEAPWILTVGASTIDRKIVSTLSLPNNEEIVGEAFFQPKDFSTMPFPLVYLEFCDSKSLNQTNVKGKIVVCEMGGGTLDSEKARTVSLAGGAAIVLINQKKEGLINSRLNPVPLSSAQVSNADGMKIKAYINSTSAPTATLQSKGTIIGDKHAPIVASFSSRGPSLASPGILKPDIIGPGVNILAAWPVSVDGRTKTKPAFNMIYGTSMACPHLSGVAALLKSAHPDWSPAAIKSAIMTTADVVNLAGNPIEDQTLEAADIFATGPGHVNPSRANDPGLVYDIEPQDYIPYLCGLNYTDREVMMITQERVRCEGVSSIGEAQLNYPSFSVVLGKQVQRYTRTVTNVGEANSSYVVRISPPIGVHVVVEPRKLDFVELHQKLTYSVTYSREESAAINVNVSQGSLTWASDKYSVRTPIVAILPR
ncbi:hypothetical protein C2S53_010033 [Perilla frutescens var. hirtella]|uniref:Uncharacterized protein n=1 Tax=Perilla frutescens var. hirtella TaxID=608512 RepID=A0AAD4NWJ0_PERFH|nr:hypothetical protein C2S53_010033 [Perilla frutescens var. hirtella]